jgi:hypothetical protein
MSNHITYTTASRTKTPNGWVTVYLTSEGDYGNHFVGFGFNDPASVIGATSHHLACEAATEWSGIRKGMTTGQL